MGNKKRIVLPVVLILTLILIAIFFFQKGLITHFSLREERVELSFDINNKILPYILLEEEYINEEYNIAYEDTKDDIGNYISIISIMKPINNEEEFFKEKFIDYLKFKIPHLNEEDLNITDYSHANRVLIEWHRAAKLFIASLLFILISIIFLKRIKIINKCVKKDIEIYYLKELIHLRLSEILEETIKLVLMVFGGIFLLQWIIKFQFNIPGKYLPANDIFDFKFYGMLNNGVKMNLSSYGQFHDITLNKVKLLTFAFLILSIAAFLLIIKMFNNKALEGRD